MAAERRSTVPASSSIFFLSVGMSLNLSVVQNNWLLILSSVIALMFTKAVLIYLLRVSRKVFMRLL